MKGINKVLDFIYAFQKWEHILDEVIQFKNKKLWKGDF